MFCQKCGKEMPENSSVCSECGSPVNSNIQETIPTNIAPTPQQVASSPNKKNKKGCLIAIVIFLILLLVVIISIVKGGGDSKDTVTTVKYTVTEKSENVIKITASDLMDAYNKNEVKADNLYKDKKLKITGTVDSIGKDVLDDTYVCLKSGDEYSLDSVQCYVVKESMDKAAELKKGDKITITGICDGGSLNVVVKKCVIN